MGNDENNSAQNNEQEEYAGGKIVQSINVGPWKFVILEKLPFWTLYTPHGPVVFDSLTSDTLKSMLKSPEVSVDPSLRTAISVAVQRKELSSVRAAISAMAQRQELASGNPHQSYGTPFAQPHSIQDFSSCQIPHYMQQHWLNTPRYRQQTPIQMFERPMVPNWVDPTQNDRNIDDFVDGAVIKNDKEAKRRSLINKIIERTLLSDRSGKIELGHCSIILQKPVNSKLIWKLKIDGATVMSCENISYIIDYIVNECDFN